jgi:hypothetical protein
MFTVAYAAETGEIVNAVFTKIVDPVIIFGFVVAFFYFMWGIVAFIRNSDNSEKRDIGKRHMVWGIVGLLIMFSCFTILQIIVNTLDLESPPNGPDYRTIDQR